MLYKLVINDEASAEFSDAFVWYEEQEEGLGKKLMGSIYNKMNLICKTPYHYKVIYKNSREAITEKFPFSIIYTIDDDSQLVTVIAIFHNSRHPKKKIIKV